MSGVVLPRIISGPNISRHGAWSYLVEWVTEYQPFSGRTERTLHTRICFTRRGAERLARRIEAPA